MTKILFVFRTKRNEMLKQALEKTGPDHFLYGLTYLKKLGYDVDYSDLFYNLPLIRYFFWPIEQLIIKITSIGFKLDQAIVLTPKAIKSDVIITTVDSAGLPFLLLKKLKIIKKPIIYISTGLINEMVKRKKSLMTSFYKFLLAEASIIICHSPMEKEQFTKLRPGLKSKIYFIPLGIDVAFFIDSKRATGNSIVSIGKDRSRDYKLIANVAIRLPSEKFIIVTDPSNIKGIKFAKNVSIYFNLPYDKIKNLYNSSKLVFIPLNELNRAIGQVNFLESLATRNNVVISKVKGITECYPDLIKLKNVFLFRAGDSLDSVEKIKKSLKRHVNNYLPASKYNSKNYARQLASILREIL